MERGRLEFDDPTFRARADRIVSCHHGCRCLGPMHDQAVKEIEAAVTVERHRVLAMFGATENEAGDVVLDMRKYHAVYREEIDKLVTAERAACAALARNHGYYGPGVCDEIADQIEARGAA